MARGRWPSQASTHPSLGLSGPSPQRAVQALARLALRAETLAIGAADRSCGPPRPDQACEKPPPGGASRGASIRRGLGCLCPSPTGGWCESARWDGPTGGGQLPLEAAGTHRDCAGKLGGGEAWGGEVFQNDGLDADHQGSIHSGLDRGCSPGPGRLGVATIARIVRPMPPSSQTTPPERHRHPRIPQRLYPPWLRAAPSLRAPPVDLRRRSLLCKTENRPVLWGGARPSG